MTILELLQRLEAKGVPLKVSVDGFEDVFVNLWNGENENHAYSEDGVWLHHNEWLIIGCVVEYMATKELSVNMDILPNGAADVTFGDKVLEAGEFSAQRQTLLEAVLTAADRALE